MNDNEFMECLAYFLIRCEEKGLITIHREPIRVHTSSAKSAETILDLIISGLVRECFLEEIRIGTTVEYGMIGKEGE